MGNHPTIIVEIEQAARKAKEGETVLTDNPLNMEVIKYPCLDDIIVRRVIEPWELATAEELELRKIPKAESEPWLTDGFRNGMRELPRVKESDAPWWRRLIQRFAA